MADNTPRLNLGTYAQGLDWQESVLERRNDPPATPSDGDRYLVDDALQRGEDVNEI